MGLADGCVVRLWRHNQTNESMPGGDDVGQQTQPEFSCSGVLIDPQNRLVLTSGQVFSEVVNRRPRGIRSLTTTRKWGISAGKRAATHAFFTAREVMKNVHIDVILPQGVQPNVKVLPALSATSIHKKVPEVDNASCRTRTHTAELVVLWKCKEFDNILKTIVPEKDGWQFSEREEEGGKKSSQSGQRSDSERDNPIGQCVEPFGLSSVSRNLPAENFISWFALLKMKEDDKDSSQLDQPLDFIRLPVLLDSLHIQQGDPVCLHTTPFGATCPSVFINSISKGIVSNVAGPRHQLIMTDARCIPGSEGGGMYVMRADNKLQDSILAGIIVAPLCWKNNEWIGLSLVCSIQAIITSLRGITQFTKQVSPPTALPGASETSQALAPSTVQRCMMSVVLIKVGAVWGSGVVVNADRGIILTCRHVVHKATDHHVRVRIDCPYLHWEDAMIVYTTGPNAPFDLAVLKLEGGVGEMREAFRSLGIRTAKSYTQGQPVIIVGHALLAPELDLLPSVSTGVMSKVIHTNNAQVMLQSTCAVHAGASGGALFCRRTGGLLGIVTSNARDVDSGASFPHVNFSVPWTFIDPILNEYLQTNDVTKLEPLGAVDVCLGAIWSLDDQKISEEEQRLLLSKL